MSRDESILSPTYLAMGYRRQLSDAHVFMENDISFKCDRCGKRRGHSDHLSKDEDRAEVRRIADRIRADQ